MDIPYVIGLSGPSCSGKTTLATVLKGLFHKVIIISQDDYFKSDDRIPKDDSTGFQNWDCPDSIDFIQFKQHIEHVMTYPEQYIIQSGHNTLNNSHKHHSVDNRVIIIIEGFMLYTDPSLSSLFNAKYFITASKDTLRKRRESRKGYTTIQGFWEDPPGYFDAIVWREYLKWNQSILDPAKRDPSIVMMNTDIDSTEDMASLILYHFTK